MAALPIASLYPRSASAAPAPGPSNVVSVCSGIRIPNSAVTAIVQPLTNATASLETTTNAILGGVAVISGLPRVATNIASLMSSAGTGYTSIQAVSTDGTLIGASGSCYSSASGFTLTAPAGIAIGGNAITGLGDSTKNAASAIELGAIAFGNGAVTASGATDAVALGSGAQVTALGASSIAIGSGAASNVANSVALGAGAIAQRGAMNGYSALGLASSQNSVGEFSVGTTGGARQVTNVAAGSSDTDAVNVAQLSGVAQSVATLGGSTVQYASGAKTSITLAGASGTTISNVAAGSLVAGSTDAVNGGQLRDTNSVVTANTNALASLGTTIAANTVAIGATGDAVNSLASNVANGRVGPVRFSDPASPAVPNAGVPSQHLTLAGAGAGPVGLHNVAAGVVAVGSTDAVNGAQLSDTNTAVATNRDAIATLGSSLEPRLDADETVIAGLGTRITANEGGLATAQASLDLLTRGGAGPVRYADPTSPTTPNGGLITPDLTLVGATTGGVRLHNLADGVIASGSTDAVNGGQLFSTNAAVADRLDAIAASVADNGTSLASIDARTSANTTYLDNLSVALGDARANIALLASGGAGPVRYSDVISPTVPVAGVSTQDLTLVGGSAGPVGLHNVADGVIADGSTDAVNGGQLHAELATIGSASALGVTYDDAGRARITLAAGNGTAVAVTNVAAANLTATSADAVNGSQLYDTNRTVVALGTRLDTLDGDVRGTVSSVSSLQSVFTNFSSLVERGGTGPLRYADAGSPTTPNGGLLSQDVTLVGISPGAVALHNVASGRLAVGSTDAVNGDQLSATNDAVAGVDNRVTGIETRLTAATGTITAIDARVSTNSDAVADLDLRVNALSNGDSGPVRYADAASPTIPNGGQSSQHLTLVGGSPGAVSLHNLAAGDVSAASTDAVNGAQLYGLGQDIQAISTQAASAVAYDDASRTRVTLRAGDGSPVVVTNVAAGSLAVGSTDAVNGDQLNGLRQSLGTTNDRLASTSDRIDVVTGDLADNDAAIGALTSRFAAFSTEVAGGAVGPLRYSSSSFPTTPNGGTVSSHVTLVGSGGAAVALHNLAPGGIGATSLDAINGAQLAALGSGFASALGLTYDGLTNAVTGSFHFGGNDYASVQSVLGVIEADMTSGPLSNGKYFHVNSVMSDSSAEGSDSTAIGPSSSSQGIASVAMGRSAVALTDSAVAIGDQAKAMGGKAVSIGVANTASGDGSVAIGDPNVATGDGSVALGKDNTATGLGAIAIGNVNASTGQGATAIGDANQVAGLGAVAVGSGNDISGEGSIAIGLGNSVAGERSIAIGSHVTNMAHNSLAIGDEAAAGGDSSAAVGNGAVASGVLSGSFGVAATATRQYALALGPASSASAFASTAVGTGATSSAFASTALGTGSIAEHEGSVALGSASQTVRGPVASYTAFGLADAQASAGEVAIARNIQYTNAENGQPTLVGDRQITGVAAGSTGTDAVNVAQLRGSASAIGDAAATALGGGATYDATTGTLTGPRYQIAGRTYSSVGDALAAIGDASGTPATGTGGGSTIGTTAPPAGAVSGSPGAIAFDDASHGSVTLAETGTAVRNVADGRVASGSTDAVNGGQLSKVQDQVAALQKDVAGSAATVLRYSTSADPTKPAPTPSNDVTLVGSDANAPVALHNIAAGTVADGSTDAVNGSQLASTNARVADAQDRATAAQAAAQTAVRYDEPERSSVTLGDGSTPVAVHNVADGTTEHDAVNLGQLASAAGAIMADDRAYTDARVSRLSFDLDKVRKDGNAGTAGALAMANMPQPYEAGRSMIAMAAGAYQGQSAFAVGLSRAMEDEHTIVKLGATYDSRGRVGAGAGVGYQF